MFFFIEFVKYIHEHNDEIKSKIRDSLVNETFPFYLDRFEKIVSDNGGYFVNGKVTYIIIIMLQYIPIYNIFLL